MPSGSFPIKITHTITTLPTKLSELEALTKETLNNTIDQLPQKVDNKTFVNNKEITGSKYEANSSAATYKTSASDVVDLVSIKGNNNKINTNKGDDFIFTQGIGNITDGGEGNDTVILSGDKNSKTNLGNGTDLVIAVGNNNQIGDAFIKSNNIGNDSVAINGNNNKIYLGDGDDIALITGEKTFVDTGSGNDQVAVSGKNNTINTYTGNDIVSVEGTSHTVNTDRGDDEVQVKGDSNLIITGIGDDTVYVNGKKNKIQTGDGNDQVIIEDYIENNITYSPDGGFADLGKGDDNVTINSIAGNFTIEGGLGANSVKLTNIDLNQYYGTYDKNVLTLFKANGTGSTLTLNLNNIQSVEFSGNNVFSLEQLTGIQGKTIEFSSSSSASKVSNIDGKSNVLQLDFGFNKIVSVNQTGTNKFNLSYLDSNSVSKTLSLDGVFHLKTTEGLTINLTQTPNFKAINADISSFKTSSTRQIGDQYTTKIFNPSSIEAYNVDLKIGKDVVLALDNSNPTVLKSYTAKQLIIDTYGNSTAINPGVLNNAVFSNSDGKTNIADFSGINTRDIYRVERLRSRASESYDNVIFTPDSTFSSLPFSTANKINVLFDGVSDLNTIVSAYNGANPLNTISYNGTGTEVLAAGTLNLESANGTYDNIDFTQDSPYYSAIPPALANKIEITFDGVSDTDTIINAYNLANPTNTVSHNGVGTDILSAGTVSLNNSTVLNNQYKVYFEDGGEKGVVLDRYNFIKTAEGHEIHLESALDTLKGGLEKELANLSPLDTTYNGLKNTQFARGAYNFLSAQNDPNKFDAISHLASATYNLLPITGNSITPIVSVSSTPSSITPSNANLIDGNSKNFFSTSKKSVTTSENFIIDLGTPTQFSKITLNARADFNGLFPDSFSILAGNDVNSLVSLGTITAAQAENGYDLASPTTAKFIKFVFNNKQLGNTSEYFAEIGEVSISDPASITTVTHATTVADVSSEQGGNLAANAIDGDNNTFWQPSVSAVETTESILLDLASSKSISTIRLRPASGETNLFPTNFSIFTGDDPFNLNLAASYTNYSPIDPLNNSINITETLGRYVKINAKTKPDGGNYSLKLAEIAVLGDNASLTLPLTVNAVSSSESANPSSDETHINDGDINTFFSSPVNASSTAHTLTFDLGSTQDLTGFNFTARPGFEGLFPTITNILVDNLPTPVTSVAGLTANGTNFSFSGISGRYVKVDFTSNQNGTTGNFYAQIAEANPVFSAAVNNKTEVNLLATALQNSLKFTSKETGYTVDEASKGLYSLRVASILRNRTDILDSIKSSGLEVQFSSKQTILNGTESAEGIASFTQGSNKAYKIQLTTDSFFDGAFDNQDGHAVDIHETVHILDFLDESPDGSPIHFNATEKLAFGTARSNLFAPLGVPLPPLGEGLLYSPGIDDPTRIANANNQGYRNSKEFLAYASEVFFERADELVALGADGASAYDKLRNYFGLNTNVADPNVNVFTNATPII